jgi:hypothetical protein
MHAFKFDIDQLLRQRLAQHILFWIAVIIYFTIGYGAPGRYGETIYRVLLFLPGHIFLTYIFFYYLIPVFLLNKKYLAFSLLGILTYILSLLYAFFVNFYLLELFQLKSIWVGSPLIAQTTMLGAALSIKFLKKYYQEKKRALEIDQQKTKAELNFLKSQVHPHFLFNTLNNLYSLVLEKSPKAPEVLLKLSELLRFLIYESSSPFIPLQLEISLMRKYIELEQLRYGDRLDVSISVQGDLENRFISPLLFLPLIENAFKHGVSNQIDQCWISLNIYMEENKLHFKLVNSKEDEKSRKHVSHKGIGLNNVKKRLELVYPEAHLFEIKDGIEMFIINLRLDLPTISSHQIQNESFTINKESYGKDKMFAGR